MKNFPYSESFMPTWLSFIEDLQDRICNVLTEANDGTSFLEEKWNRPGGGGGRTRVISDGSIHEKGGVNISHVYGEVTPQMKNLLGIEDGYWAACGLSMVLHPYNPHIPTFHANWRYFEVKNHKDGEVKNAWFGGGMDLTPYYLVKEDVSHFHQVLKTSLDPFHPECYAKYKEECDDYFCNHHRNGERRGVGGVFYDHLIPENNPFDWDIKTLFKFQKANSQCFFDAYIPIILKHKFDPFTPEQKYWQEIRRGRYVEFNLIHDRGTIFGLKTNGRTESILMSLPPTVRFDYNFQPKEGTPEAELLDVLLHPKSWIDP